MALFDWLLGGKTPERGNERTRRDRSEMRQHTPVVKNRGRAPRQALDVPTDDFRFVALDVETACSDSASICQIGLACVFPDNRIHTFSTLVNPGMRFDPFNIRLHGIGPDQVADALRFDEALEHLLPLLSRHQLVQHSNFDKQAVTAACRWHSLDAPEFRWSDSVRIARRAWPELKGNGGHGLANLKKVLDLDFHHHDAGEDARAAAMVVLRAEADLGLPFDDLIKPAPKRNYAPAIIKEGNPAGALAGLVVVFTGALGTSRTEAAELAAGIGMSVKAGVTQKTTHLVVGDQDLSVLAGHEKSSKHRKAEEMQSKGHPIQIIGETEFKALATGSGPV